MSKPTTRRLEWRLRAGALVEVGLSPKQEAIIVKPVKPQPRVRGRHRIEDLIEAMPKGYKTAGFAWSESIGREVW